MLPATAPLLQLVVIVARRERKDDTLSHQTLSRPLGGKKQVCEHIMQACESMSTLSMYVVSKTLPSVSMTFRSDYTSYLLYIKHNDSYKHMGRLISSSKRA